MREAHNALAGAYWNDGKWDDASDEARSLRLDVDENAPYYRQASTDSPDGLVSLVVDDALFDPGHKLRRVTLHYLPDTGLKLVEDVDARVAANGRGKSFEGRRSGARPIWAVSSGD